MHTLNSFLKLWAIFTFAIGILVFGIIFGCWLLTHAVLFGIGYVVVIVAAMMAAAAVSDGVE